VAGEQDQVPQYPPFFPPMWPTQPGPVAGVEEQLPPPTMPIPSPFPVPGPVAPAADFPPSPWCPPPQYPTWPPYPTIPPAPGPTPPTAPPGFPTEPEITEPGLPEPTVPGVPTEPDFTEPGFPAPTFPEVPEMPEVPGTPGAPVSPVTPPLSPAPGTPGEPVEVEPGEAVPGEPEAISYEEADAKQIPPALLLGTLEGVVSVIVGNRPARPLTNNLVLIFNRVTGERFQAYTDNSGFYSRRVPEGRYIIQIRQRICAPFVRQRLARVHAQRRTVANINVNCPAGFPGSTFSKDNNKGG
jgi:hypothetical protein